MEDDPLCAIKGLAYIKGSTPRASTSNCFFKFIRSSSQVAIPIAFNANLSGGPRKHLIARASSISPKKPHTGRSNYLFSVTPCNALHFVGKTILLECSTCQESNEI